MVAISNDVSLKELFIALLAEHEKSDQERIRALEHKIIGLERLLEVRMASQALAVEKAADGYNARFASANEFRAAMQDLSGTFATRELLDKQIEDHSRRIGNTENRLANIDGRVIGWSSGVGFFVLVISLILRLIEG